MDDDRWFLSLHVLFINAHDDNNTFEYTILSMTRQTCQKTGLETIIGNGVKIKGQNYSPRHHSAWSSALKAVPTVARSSIVFFFWLVMPTPALVFVEDALDPVLVSVLAPF